jgi:hypothetical protein
MGSIRVLFTVTFAMVVFTMAANHRAIGWYDDFSDLNDTVDPTWIKPLGVGNYDASSGDYILSGDTDWDDDRAVAVVGEPFADTSVRTRAYVERSTVENWDIDADFDDDNNVDGQDLLIWQRGNGLTGVAENSDGDANYDWDVNGSDLNGWKDQFGGAPTYRGGNVGVLARLDPNTGNTFMIWVDAGGTWRIQRVDAFDVFTTLADSADYPGDYDSRKDIMIQLDVTGQGDNVKLDLYLWDPAEPMPEAPLASVFDTTGFDPINGGVAGILFAEDNDGTSGVFRYVEASSTHLGASPAIAAVPEPAGLSLMALAALAAGCIIRRRRIA